jgi:hypothetical protein
LGLIFGLEILEVKEDEIWGLKDTINGVMGLGNRRVKEYEELSRRYKLMLEENRDLISKYEDVVMSMNDTARGRTPDDNLELILNELDLVKNQ